MHPKFIIGLMVILFSVQAKAVLVEFEVGAASNSSTGGSGLPTGIIFAAGELITGSVDPGDIWNAGQLPRWSNADGLDGELLATGTDESLQMAGDVIGIEFPLWTQAGLTAPYGSLIGQIDGNFFFLGTSLSVQAPLAGELLLYYWDENVAGNTDFVTVTLENGIATVPIPGALIFLASGIFALAAQVRRRKSTMVLRRS